MCEGGAEGGDPFVLTGRAKRLTADGDTDVDLSG